jgi:hypothetical protein
MSNPSEAYARHARRVARLIEWLGWDLQRHEQNAGLMHPAYLQPMVKYIQFVEHTLTLLVAFAAGDTPEAIKRALNNGGQDHE